MTTTAPRLLRPARSTADRDLGPDQAGLPAAGPQIPPRHEQRRPGGRRALQADHRSLRGAVRPRPAAELRPHPAATAHSTGLTTPGDDNGDAISAVLRVLEATWQAIRARQPQIPPVVIVIASGTDGKQARWGHHAPQRWRVGLEDRAEIMISGEGLKRGAPAVLGTLLHEAAHALAAARGIQDTSRQGRYHNKRLQDPRRGTRHHHRARPAARLVDHHRPRNHPAVSYARQLYELQNAITLWRHDEHDPGRNHPAHHQPDRRRLPVRPVHPDRRLHPRRSTRHLPGLRRRLHRKGRRLTLKRQPRAAHRP